MVGWLARYFERAEQQGWQRLGAEIEMKVTLGRAVVSGRVDRLERLPDGSLRVIDYKTGSSKPREDDLPTHPQLGAYQVAVTGGAFGEHGTTTGGAALLQIGKGANKRDITLQEQRPLPTHDDPQWAERLIAETADGMAGATFTATVGSWCDQCAVRSSCPAQPEGKTL
jgi:RecB family exonuclease